MGVRRWNGGVPRRTTAHTGRSSHFLVFISLVHDNLSAFPSFRTTGFAEDAGSVKFNDYSLTVGVSEAHSVSREWQQQLSDAWFGYTRDYPKAVGFYSEGLSSPLMLHSSEQQKVMLGCVRVLLIV